MKTKKQAPTGDDERPLMGTMVIMISEPPSMMAMALINHCNNLHLYTPGA
jgi:hypothetical protein